jgi:hypothetical protein
LPFDFVGRFEQLEEGIQTIAQKLQVDVSFPHVNAIPRDDSAEGTPDMLPRELKSQGKFPSYLSFYDKILRKKVRALYEGDVALGYNFEGLA